jgi:DNA-binding NarL/FixJ family response regulator
MQKKRSSSPRTRAISKACPDAKMLSLTLHDSLEWVETVLHAGARGYLLKSDMEGEELMRALNVVAGMECVPAQAWIRTA